MLEKHHATLKVPFGNQQLSQQTGTYVSCKNLALDVN
jgi:hypothetical protein